MEGNQVDEAQELIERAFISACFIDEGVFDLYRASGIGPQAFQRATYQLIKRLRYGGLIAQAGLASGAKPAT